MLLPLPLITHKYPIDGFYLRPRFRSDLIFLLLQLTSRLRPTFGAVRRLYTVEGSRVAALDQVTDGEF